MKIKDVMTKNVRTIPCEKSAQEAAALMRDHWIGVLPVVEDQKIVGMVTDRDLAIRVVAAGKGPIATPLKDVMTEGVRYCYEDQTLEEVTDNMGDMRLRRLVVLDRDKNLVGILTLGDIASQETPHSNTHEMLKEICA